MGIPIHVVVLGGGFAGVAFCHTFKHQDVRITLVDRSNHHLFQPLLYQVATAGLSAPEIAQPIRSIFSDRKDITILMDNVTQIDTAHKQVVMANKTLDYDYLVVGLGGRTNYFGHSDWEQFAPGLKSLEDAVYIRSNVLRAFEKAENTSNVDEHDRLLTVVVVGGGPTGVELAGAFAELAHHVLEKDFRHIDPKQAKIILIESNARVLSGLPESLSINATKQLTRMGVQIKSNVQVKQLEKNRVVLSSGEVLFAENIIWAAGVAASPLAAQLSEPADRSGRVKVNSDLSLPDHPEVFVVGDMAYSTGNNGKVVPGVSPAAIQMAEHAAKIIQAEITGQPKRPAFRYWDKGTMATIGRNKAVAKIGWLELTGFPAWASWLFLHLLFLVGFRNKVAVLVQWIYSYFTYKRGSRIITNYSAK